GIEVAPRAGGAAGAGTAVQVDGGDTIRIPAGFPVDAVVVTDVEHAALIRFDRRVAIWHDCLLAMLVEVPGASHSAPDAALRAVARRQKEGTTSLCSAAPAQDLTTSGRSVRCGSAHEALAGHVVRGLVAEIGVVDVAVATALRHQGLVCP